MEIPIRCFSCGKVIAHLWEPFQQKLEEGKSPDTALNELNVRKQCCRRMLLSHIELIDQVIPYELKFTPPPKEEREEE